MTIEGKKEIDYIQCVHARYFEAIDNSDDDLVLVKELVHYTDGTIERRLKPRVNVERPFWITKEGFRNHQEKKEWELAERLQKFTCTQRNLTAAIRKAMGGVPSPRDRYKILARSPFLYGSDITTPVLIKNAYDKRMEGREVAPCSVAVLDLETDTLRGTDEIVTGAIVTEEVVYCYYTKAYQGTSLTLEDKLRDYKFPLIAERCDISKIKFHVELVNSPEDVTIKLLQRAHELKPDFLAIWNMNFDIPKMINSLESKGINPADHFCDPEVPAKFRFFKYREAPRQKVMASGKVMNKHAADLWHVVDCPSTFYVVDAMCLYKLSRVAKGMEPSYSLDAILHKHKLGGKLSFDIGDECTQLEWHQIMSSKHKVEYLEYNIYDCLSMIHLDLQTKDISTILPLLCGHSELAKFTSTPRRLADDVEFMCYERNQVAGTCSDNMTEGHNKEVLSLKDWIVTLPGHHIAKDAGIPLYGEDDKIRSGVLTHGYDSDVRGAYPSSEIALNISKETTVAELCRMDGMSMADFRKVVLNMTAANVNAVEIVSEHFGAPNPLLMNKLFQEHLANS